MNVIVTAYNPNWPALYEQEAQAIRQILGKELIAIHHIGSTSVPGLFAKPIIDIMPVVAHIEAVDPLSAQFEALGYEVMGNSEFLDADIFAKVGTTEPIKSIFSNNPTNTISSVTLLSAIFSAAIHKMPKPMGN